MPHNAYKSFVLIWIWNKYIKIIKIQQLVFDTTIQKMKQLNDRWPKMLDIFYEVWIWLSVKFPWRPLNGLSWEFCGLSWVLCGLFWVVALTYIMGQFWRLCCFRVKPKPALIFLVTNNVSTADRGKPSGEITSSESQG